MSKFLRQDYSTHVRLKNKWRRPKGKQSKLRVSKSGSGVRPRIGFKRHGKPLTVVNNIAELENVKGSVLLASRLGAKKAWELAKRADELGIRILNKRKLKSSEKIFREREQRKQKVAQKKAMQELKKLEEAKKKDESKEQASEMKEEKKSDAQ